jgi:hypothetical protein
MIFRLMYWRNNDLVMNNYWPDRKIRYHVPGYISASSGVGIHFVLDFHLSILQISLFYFLNSFQINLAGNLTGL